MATFDVLCPSCNTKVMAHTLLGGDELKAALKSDTPIKVMHPPAGNGGDHSWTLGIEDRKRLAKQVAEGLVRT
jgi:hypothetical protein